MGAALIGWAGLVLVFVVPGVLAHGFSRRTLRTAMLMTLVATMVVVTRMGLPHRGRPPADLGVAEPAAQGAGVPQPDNPHPCDQGALLEELKVRLPAVEVGKPATMPGGSTLEALASLISDSSATGAKATAALMQAVHALEAQPRIYEVRIYTQRMGPGSTSPWTFATPAPGRT
jgi:hypothetical protein